MTIPRPGDRIRLLSMLEDPNPIPVGQVGTVVGVARHGGNDAWDQIDVEWDNGRALMLLLTMAVRRKASLNHISTLYHTIVLAIFQQNHLCR